MVGKNKLNSDQIAREFMDLPRRSKQWIVFAVDTIQILFTVWLSISLRHDDYRLPEVNEIFAYIIALLIALPIFIRAGFYNAIFRYSGVTALGSIAKVCLQYGALYFLLIFFFSDGIPRSIGIMQPMLLILAVVSSRAWARFWFHPGNASVPISCIKEKFLIFGAGASGVQIATALRHNSTYSVVGFIDDNTTLIGKSINDMTVYGSSSVPLIIKQYGITCILIAVPSASRSRRQEIIRSFEGLNVHIRMLPGIEAIADGKVSISDIREVEIEDILGRDPVAPTPELFARCITGKRVLVTGAGGSIGSELCRQILALNPSKLILFEQSEYNLYALNKELEASVGAHGYLARIIPVLGDVTERIYVRQVFRRYQPETVYHAAAYKHVPMVEQNPFQGIRNNVFGTLYVAEAARMHGISHLVLVSTDKAVRPTNIMGASKRIAELVLQAMAGEQNGEGTCFSMVRFGNVLGSSGSVVPLFRQQISDGGPITVTHREVTRYFMTIPEAAQLVIQAGAMATGGDVFLLDMGDPVRILDLAKRMVVLSGLTIKDDQHPDGDIKIEITGLRPGEKLYEELLIADKPIPTLHPRIFKAHETMIDMDELALFLQKLESMIGDETSSIICLKRFLRTLVTGYQYETATEDHELIDTDSCAFVP